ncbi:AraC family transcriptional regulator [Parapedobacter sp.]
MQPQLFYPHPALQPYIQHYVFIVIGTSGNREKLSVVPAGSAILAVKIDGLKCFIKNDDRNFIESPSISFTGQTTRFHTLELIDQHRLLFVVFKPCGPFRLLGIDQHHFTDGSEDIANIFEERIVREIRGRIEGAQAPTTVKDIVEQFLLQLLISRKKPSSADRMAYVMGQLVARCNEPQLIKEICNDEGFTKTTLDRQIKTMLGITPKQYQIIARFNTVLRYIRRQQNIRWTDVAYHFGYYDQAHFIKEFKLFYGRTPTLYSCGDELLSNIAHL